ncbi:ThiF family adenylyltransferase [Bacillus alkalicellulosilyticus]|uniref:ThiF family adenylyltransferase n=1 Tax=Alkalihalobacterium alkalicellulosilyticum TaxID=1912214 RepID=UPI0009974879|nr:ThiF family adenylyltransferase [Bacillus alkalicellulosilyticus]
MKPIDLLKESSKDIIYPYIIQVGTGGTGSLMVQHIAQMLSTFNINGQYILADPDIIERKNLRNQLFLESEIGKSKAEVLANRYRTAYNIQIGSYTKGYVEDVQTLKSLFKTDYLNIGYTNYVLFLPVIIGCVDNNFTRKILHEFFQTSSQILYIDVGNDSVNVPHDYVNRPRNEWTKEEIDNYENTGWTGQAVCGLKLNRKTLLPPVAEVFPDILEDNDEIAPSQLSCSELLASDPQRSITNKMAAMSMGVLLNKFFESNTISKHKVFFHAEDGFMRAQ